MAAEDFLPSSDDSSDKPPSSQDDGSNKAISFERVRKLQTSNNPYKPRFAPAPWPGFFSSLDKLAASEKWESEILPDRPMTKDEEVALREISTKEFNAVRRTITITKLIGTTLGLWRAFRTRSIWKFPFIKPSGVFNADVMHFGSTTIVLHGPDARNAWRISRYAAYGLVGAGSGVALGMVSSNIPAIFAGGYELKFDPRLKELREASRTFREEEKADRENYKMVERAFHYGMNKQFKQCFKSNPWWRCLFWREKRSTEEMSKEFAEFFVEGLEKQLPEEDQRKIREAREKKEQEKLEEQDETERQGD